MVVKTVTYQIKLQLHSIYVQFIFSEESSLTFPSCALYYFNAECVVQLAEHCIIFSTVNCSSIHAISPVEPADLE